jgi:hypothetical protein
MTSAKSQRPASESDDLEKRTYAPWDKGVLRDKSHFLSYFAIIRMVTGKDATFTFECRS